MPTLSVKDATNATIVVNTMNANGQAVIANSQSVVVASDQVVSTLPKTVGTHYQPGYSIIAAAGAALSADPAGNLAVRGQALTDEGGYRCNFANSSLSVSIGSCTFTGGSLIVVGTGFNAADIHPGDYVKVDAHSETTWVQIETIDSATQLTLASTYSGTTATGASSRALLKSVTGAGASITVASGVATIAAGTTTGARTELEREADWLPVVKQSGVTISQRIVQQSIHIGLYDEMHPATPYFFAWFLADGATNTTIKCQSARNPTAAPSAAETEETIVTLPAGVTTAVANRYRVEVLGDRVLFYINGVQVAAHYRAMPGPGDLLTSAVRVVNGTSPASNTNVLVDYDVVRNHNRLEVGFMSDAEPVVAVNPTADDFSYNVAGVITINTDLLVIDCSRYRTLTIQCVAMGATGVVTPAFSNDNGTTYVAGTLLPSTGGTAAVSTFGAAGIWVVPVTGRLARIRLTTATTSGTTTLRIAGTQQVSGLPLGTVAVTATNLSTNVAQMGGVAVTMGNGVAGTGVQRVAFASDNTANSNPWLSTVVASAAQGASTTHHLISAASTNATSVKASAGAINTLQVSNLNVAVRYLKLYNKASGPTVGTDTPVMTILLPASSNQFIDCGAYGIRFTTGIAYALTVGMAIADTGAVAITEHSVSIFYT